MLGDGRGFRAGRRDDGDAAGDEQQSGDRCGQDCAAKAAGFGLDRRDRNGRDGFDRCRYERLEGWFHANSLLSAGSPLVDEPHPERGERA